MAALKAHRENLIDPTISEHHGRIVNLMGDGALVEFASAVGAVECVVEIQNGMAKRNAEASGDHPTNGSSSGLRNLRAPGKSPLSWTH